MRGPSAPVAVDETNVYLGGSSRRVVAVDLASGKTRWSVRLAGPLVGGVLRQGEVIYAATDQPGGKVHALQAESGSEIWNRGTGYVQAPLTLAEDRIIVLNRRREVLALELGDGDIVWRRRLPSTLVPAFALGDGRILISSFDSVYALRVRDGAVLIRRPAPGPVASPWVRVGRDLVAGTGDSLLVALSPDSLTESWRVRLDAPLLVSPTSRGDTLYCVTRIGTVYRILPGSPPRVEELHGDAWPATGAPALLNQWLLVGGSDGILHAFRTEDGMEDWKVSLGRPLEIAPIPLPGGGFLALGGRGDLHRMRP